MVEIETEGKRKLYKVLDDEKYIPVYITDENGNKLYVTDDFIDISYSSRKSESTVLSNMFPYTFVFDNYKVASAEGVLQGLKHKDIYLQQEIFNYSGKDAYHIRVAAFMNDWRKSGLLYFKGNEINRFSIEYQHLLNSLYLSLMINPLFANSLKYTGSKELIHSDGVLDPTETVLTPKEYILRLEYMRNYLLNEINETMLHKRLDTLAEVIAEEQARIVYQKRFN